MNSYSMKNMKLIKSYIKLIIDEAVSQRRPFERKLRVFDFDDTLVKTGSKIHVITKEGEKFDLTPGEYAVYVAVPGDQFDYSDFEDLIDPKLINWTVKILRAIINKGDEVVILTARANPEPVKLFLQQANLPLIEIAALGSSIPEKKAEYIKNRIEKDNLQHVEFFDDSYKNVIAVQRLANLFPDVNIVVRHITTH